VAGRIVFRFPLLATVVALNLTPGGIGGKLSNQDTAKAIKIRHHFLSATEIPDVPPPPAPPEGVTAEYGHYLAEIAGCIHCHGPNLAGGPLPGVPDAPPAANLTPAGLKRWKEADLFKAIHQGEKPDGSRINAFMPWQDYRHMSTLQLKALWLYLKTVPPVPSKNQ
jgi:mono/diheme cytochrome c family protein